MARRFLGNRSSIKVGGGGSGEITPDQLLEILVGSDYISVDMNTSADKVQVEFDFTDTDSFISQIGALKKDTTTGNILYGNDSDKALKYYVVETGNTMTDDIYHIPSSKTVMRHLIQYTPVSYMASDVSSSNQAQGKSYIDGQVGGRLSIAFVENDITTSNKVQGKNYIDTQVATKQPLTRHYSLTTRENIKTELDSVANQGTTFLFSATFQTSDGPDGSNAVFVGSIQNGGGNNAFISVTRIGTKITYKSYCVSGTWSGWIKTTNNYTLNISSGTTSGTLTDEQYAMLNTKDINAEVWYGGNRLHQTLIGSDRVYTCIRCDSSDITKWYFWAMIIKSDKTWTIQQKQLTLS